MKLNIIAEGGLSQWFDDKWVDVSRKKDGKHPPCGRSDSSKGGYPKCVPSKKAKSMSTKDKKSASNRKRKNPSKQVSTETFSNRLDQALGLISEGMNVVVNGYRNTDIHDLGDLSNTLQSLLTPYWNRLSKDIQQEIMTKGMPGGSFHVDGDTSYFGKEGIINYYTAGWPSNMQPQIVDQIKTKMDKLGIKYGPFKEEQSGLLDSRVIRIPVLHLPAAKQDAPPEVNLSNDNAIAIFQDVLGFKNDNYSFSMHPFELINAIDNLNPDKLDIHARDERQTTYKDGAVSWYGGQDKQDIIRKLGYIKKVAQWAIKNNYELIDVH